MQRCKLADHGNYTLRKALKALNFIIRILKKGNTKRLSYTALVRPILDYGAVCCDPYREDQVSALNRVQKRVAEFAYNINESIWNTLAQRRIITRICALLKAYTGGWALKAKGNRLLTPCYLSRDHLNRQIRTKKQKTDVDKYSFVNRTIKRRNQLRAGLLVLLPCKLNIFRTKVKSLVTSKGIQVWIECK